MKLLVASLLVLAHSNPVCPAGCSQWLIGNDACNTCDCLSTGILGACTSLSCPQVVVEPRCLSYRNNLPPPTPPTSGNGCKGLEQGDIALCRSPTNKWRSCKVVAVHQWDTCSGATGNCKHGTAGYTMNYLGFGVQHNEMFDMSSVESRMRCNGYSGRYPSPTPPPTPLTYIRPTYPLPTPPTYTPRPCYQQSTGLTIPHGQSVISGHSRTYGQHCTCRSGSWSCSKAYPNPPPTPGYGPGPGGCTQWRQTHSNAFCGGSWQSERKQLHPWDYSYSSPPGAPDGVATWAECAALAEADPECGNVLYFSTRRGECRCVRRGRRCQQQATYTSDHSIYKRTCDDGVVPPSLPPSPPPAPTPPSQDQDCYSEPNQSGRRYLIARLGQTVANCAGRSCTCVASTGSGSTNSVMQCAPMRGCGSSSGGGVSGAASERQDYALLSADEKQILADALLWVHDECTAPTASGGGKPHNPKCGRRADGSNAPWSFREFLADHQRQSAHAHGTPKFLPWHRVYLRELEVRLQRFHTCAAIPYWDWTRDSGSESLASVYDHRVFGGHERNLGRFDPSGASGYSRSAASWDLGWGAFNRRGSISPHATFASKHWADQLLAINTGGFKQFSERLEGGAGHVAPHLFIGGQMGGMVSPADPLFWLHHAMIDKLWADWQAAGAGSSRLTGAAAYDDSKGSRATPLSPQWVGTTVADALAPDACYVPPGFTTVSNLQITGSSSSSNSQQSQLLQSGQGQTQLKAAVARALRVSSSRVTLQRKTSMHTGGHSSSNGGGSSNRRYLRSRRSLQQQQPLLVQVQVVAVSLVDASLLVRRMEDPSFMADNGNIELVGTPTAVAYSNRPAEHTDKPYIRADLAGSKGELTALGTALLELTGGTDARRPGFDTQRWVDEFLQQYNALIPTGKDDGSRLHLPRPS